MKILTLLILVLFYTTGYTQSVSSDVISPAGESSQSPNIHLSWTIGELAVEDKETGFGMLTEGFHQGNLVVQKLTTTENTIDINNQIQVSVFPNPVRSTLTIERENPKNQNMQAILYDAQGRIYLTSILLSDDGQSTLDVSSLAQGIYFLKLQDQANNLRQVFMISKK